MFSKMYLEITNVCNLHCSFCPGTRRKARFLSCAEFRLLAARLRPHGRFLYFHLMGEPLLHPALVSLLSIAAELDFRVVITSNGTMLEEKTDSLLTAPALHKVNISLHAPEANSGMVPFNQYLRGCTDFAQRAAQRGIICNFRLWNLDGVLTRGAHEKNDEVLAALHAAFPSEWVENTRGMRLADKVFLEWGEKFIWPSCDGAVLAERGFCYALRDQVGVLCDGTVVPCCLDHEGDLPLGNLFETDLEKILAAPRARALYDGFSARVPAEPFCKTCGYARRFD